MPPTSPRSSALIDAVARLFPGSSDTPEEGAVLGAAAGAVADLGVRGQALPLSPAPEPLVVAQTSTRPITVTDTPTAMLRDADNAPVEPGRALALADFSPPQVSASERLIRLAYGFGLPPSALITIN